ncbi:MAG: PQQ-dependent sugar dehydrogenase, partial [Oricola sp.]|nr:PQQ-dependent sugar dehydrogenase [Oricola sp.]
MMIKPAFLTALALAIALPAAADTVIETTEHADIAANVVADGLSHPWGMDILPDGALIVTERESALRIVRDGAVSDPVAGLPDIAVVGQGGLLDVA